MKSELSALFSVMAVVLVGTHRAAADSHLTSVTLSPQSPSVACRGAAATNVVTVTRVESGALDVYLTATGLPVGATATFSPNPIRFKNNTSSMDATLVITTEERTFVGANPFQVIATTGGQDRNCVTNTGSLELTMCSAGAAPMANGQICVAFDVQPGQDCRVQATTDLNEPITWTTLCTTSTGTNSLFLFVDADSVNLPQRFYRMAFP